MNFANVSSKKKKLNAAQKKDFENNFCCNRKRPITRPHSICPKAVVTKRYGLLPFVVTQWCSKDEARDATGFGRSIYFCCIQLRNNFTLYITMTCRHILWHCMVLS